MTRENDMEGSPLKQIFTAFKTERNAVLFVAKFEIYRHIAAGEPLPDPRMNSLYQIAAEVDVARGRASELQA